MMATARQKAASRANLAKARAAKKRGRGRVSISTLAQRSLATPNTKGPKRRFPGRFTDNLDRRRSQGLSNVRKRRTAKVGRRLGKGIQRVRGYGGAAGGVRYGASALSGKKMQLRLHPVTGTTRVRGGTR